MSQQVIINIDDQLERAARAVLTVIKSELQKGVNRAALEVANIEKDTAPQGQMTLVNSINVTSGPDLTKYVGPSVHYAQNIINGRRPGQAPPPVQALLDWVKTKGITSTKYKTQLQLAKAISFAVGKKGIAANDFVTETVDASRDTVQNIIKAAISRGLEDVGL